MKGMTALTWAGKGVENTREPVLNLEKWALCEKPENGQREKVLAGELWGEEKRSKEVPACEGQGQKGAKA